MLKNNHFPICSVVSDYVQALNIEAEHQFARFYFTSQKFVIYIRPKKILFPVITCLKIIRW